MSKPIFVWVRLCLVSYGYVRCYETTANDVISKKNPAYGKQGIYQCGRKVAKVQKY